VTFVPFVVKRNGLNVDRAGADRSLDALQEPPFPEGERHDSRFNDGFRAEDLLAIPDLAAGAFSVGLTELGKSNIPKRSDEASNFLII
jgi:hypothetical protein